MPKISVIVPVYNVENILNVCVESIVKQTFSDLEIILVDDGSIDKSGFICDEWSSKDSRVRVIHQVNGGQCSARNAGLDVATGDYIMFVDSDDCIDKEMCKKLYNLSAEYDADYVKCDFIRFSKLDDIKSKPEDSGEVKLYSPQGAFQNFICAPYSSKKHFIPIVCASLYKRYLFEELRFSVGKIYEEGYVLPTVFLNCKKLVHLAECLYYYSYNPNGTMASALTDKGLKSFDDWKEIHFLVAKRFPELAAPSAKRWVSKYIDLYRRIVESDNLDKDRYYARIIESDLKDNFKYLSKLIEKESINEIKFIGMGEVRYKKYLKRKASTTSKVIAKLNQLLKSNA